MPIKEQKISSFFGGISDSTRKPTASEFAITKNMDVFTDPNRLIPYRSFETDTNDGSSPTGMKQYYLRDFVYSSTSPKLYALGQNASSYPKIFYKADATTGNWIIPSSSEGNGAVKYGCLAEYRDYLWGFQGTAQVFKWGLLSGTPSITQSAGSVGTVYSTVTGVTIAAGGSGYQVNDILTIQQGNKSCRLLVTGVSTGAVTSVAILEAGYNQTVANTIATAVVPTGGSSCTVNITSVANVTTPITSVAQGIVGLDDNLYLGYNNIVVRVYPSGTVQDQTLKLPKDLKITSFTQFGKYLGISCAPKDGYNGNSKTFLWNYTSPDVQESIDWGEGELKVIETIDGMIVGITDRYTNNSVGAGRGSIVIQGFTGGFPQVLKEVFTQKLTGQVMSSAKTVKNNRVFFTAKVFINATDYYEGIWSFGRKNINYPWALSLDYSDDTINSSGIQSFGSAGNYFFIAHSNDGSILKTNDTAVYGTAIYEPNVIDFGDAEADKRLDSVKVRVRRLLSGEAITIYYKVDDETAWTEIGTLDTDDKVYFTFYKNLDGTNFKSGNEYKFRFVSTGGAEITNVQFKAEPLT